MAVRLRQSGNRGLILPVVLIMLMLLAMMGMAFSLATSAELGAAEARANRMQTRLAAEAGLQRVLLLLRQNRAKMSLWWDNPELRDVQFYPPATEAKEFGQHDMTLDKEDKEEGQTLGTLWRYSIVAVDLDAAGEEVDKPIRWGIQDESGKLNINWATQQELTALFQAVLDPELPVEELVDALVDWRDKDDTTSPAGAESDYYRQLTPPYSAANAPLKTVEELLLVKGFTARVLYGEDFNRNGILDPSEDDGTANFPPDNADGHLNRGLLPYITVYSMGQDRASDNKPRLYLNSKPEEIEMLLGEMVDSSLAEFILEARGQGYVFKSPAELGGEIKLKGQADGEGTTFQAAPEDILLAMDRLTTIPRPTNMGPLGAIVAVPLPHVINVNTAPPPVLACLGLTGEQIEQLVAARRGLSDEEKVSPGWLLNAGIMTPEELAEFTGAQLNRLRIVTQSWQFTVESVGYGDHVGMVSRLQAVIEMQGQVPLIKYFRDLTKLGPAWPIRAIEEDREITATTG
ncbi:MAG: general secretion pathway protein GspK [Phycisphaerae bacterium]|nr:general secretion pathway protein GspK [Phycisphaerae bacterium]